MKIAENTAVESTMTGADTHRCSVDPAGMAQMIYAFTHLYSDTKLAVVREYVANGVDSHRRAGQDTPVELMLPAGLSTGLSVRDRGVGLSRDDILNVYGQYWASTKRDDPDQIGWFGLGAKAAFTVTTQFTVRAVKDGWLTVALFHLGADGVPSYTFLAHEPSGEPNGVSVTIPTDPADQGEWAGAARAVCGTMPAGLVLVDGKAPETALTETARLDENLWYLHGQDRGLSAVMGGLRYQVPADVGNHAFAGLTGTDRRWFLAGHLVVQVELGSLDLTPSREAVRDTNRTRQTLRDALVAARGRIADRHREQVEGLPATARALAHNTFWPDRRANYLLASMRVDANLPSDVTAAVYWSKQPNDPWGRRTVAAPSVCGTILVVACAGDEAGRARYWAKGSPLVGDDTTLIIAPSGSGRDGWLSWGVPDSPVQVVTLEELVASTRAARPPKPKGSRVKKEAAPKAEVTYMVVAPDRTCRAMGVEAINAIVGVVAVTPGRATGPYSWPEGMGLLLENGAHVVLRGSRGEAATRARIRAGVSFEEAFGMVADRLLAGLDPARVADAAAVRRRALQGGVDAAKKFGFINAEAVLTAWSDWTDVPAAAVDAARLAGRLGEPTLTGRCPILSATFGLLSSRALLALLDVADLSRVMPPAAA